MLAGGAARADLGELDQLPALTCLVARADELLQTRVEAQPSEATQARERPGFKARAGSHRVEVLVGGRVVNGHRAIAILGPARVGDLLLSAAPIGKPRAGAVEVEELLLGVGLAVRVLALLDLRGAPRNCALRLCVRLLLFLLPAVLARLQLYCAIRGLDLPCSGRQHATAQSVRSERGHSNPSSTYLDARALGRLLLARLDGDGNPRRQAADAIPDRLGDELAARGREEAGYLEPAVAHDGREHEHAHLLHQAENLVEEAVALGPPRPAQLHVAMRREGARGRTGETSVHAMRREGARGSTTGQALGIATDGNARATVPAGCRPLASLGASARAGRP